jgi:hypothetical protein
MKPLWSWVILIAFCALIIAWGFVNFRLVQDAPRHWDFGALPAAPSQSIYSTMPTPQPTTLPRQIVPLPEAQTATNQSPTGQGAQP